MARQTDTYDIYQDHRLLFWRSSTQVTQEERDYITPHVGNVHTIPAERKPHIARALCWARRGELVALEGFLVTIQDAGANELARSSTVRTDTGPGACEGMWVDRIRIEETVWE